MIYNPFISPLANQVNGLIRVTGREGAMAYPLGPNSVVPLFDGEEDILYVKSTDGAGFPTIREFELKETNVETVETDSISRAEFNELKAMVANLSNEEADKNAKQPISRTKK